MLEILFALGAGVISFLSPCVLPLIPGYISYISGSSLKELVDKKNINLIPIILFSLSRLKTSKFGILIRLNISFALSEE